MEIMTEEYCRQCPWFDKKLGYLQADHLYWKDNPDKPCLCKVCDRRLICERDGPIKEYILICFENLRSYFACKGRGVMSNSVRHKAKRLWRARLKATEGSTGEAFRVPTRGYPREGSPGAGFRPVSEVGRLDV